jgi:uncharacterized membrane protein YcaP (DUF421 family)
MDEIFRLSMNPAELVLRGTAVYWFLFLLFRFVLRRDVGSIAIADVLLLVLIADASQNAMAGGYTSVSEGAILVATIGGWNYLLDWVAFRFPAVRKVLEAPSLVLVRNGQLQRANMRREMVTLDELKAKLREHGLEGFEEVKVARMESDGEITVIKRESAASKRRSPTDQAPNKSSPATGG